MPSIFTKIIHQEIPSYKIFEDEYVYAFLDISPISVGHTLVVPKIEVDYLFDLPEPYFSEVFRCAKNIASAIQNAVNCDRVGLLVEGFEVAHAHVHLVPMQKLDALKFEKPRAKLSPEKMQNIAKSIQKEMAKYS